ncbi:MAG: 2-amino-4-hydroxy-6-hydroxymethyldihydropteridine diphosphokinase [Prevotellaceae bacterium]|nr:2-amino-4-hydroxy-6-hydroxymethyldihydropteridine diphosphokinase [Prevotellaceae bacterium]
MKKSKVYLLLGSDTGDKKKHICDASDLVKNEIGEIITESSMYVSEAWGFDSDTLFFNKVIVVETDLNAFEILDITQKIEIRLGRIAKTTGKYQSRTIDIDILFYDNAIIETQQLTVPHPQIQNRRFTLQPLTEIASDFVHPVLHKSILLMLSECNDKSSVELAVC